MIKFSEKVIKKYQMKNLKIYVATSSPSAEEDFVPVKEETKIQETSSIIYFFISYREDGQCHSAININ